jgi:RNA polymerase sigma-70 factor (sigma-E family)
VDAADAAPGIETFDDFYERTRDRLAVHVAALTGDPAEAPDHVQEAFIRAWARWGRVGKLDDPEGWVRRVAHNLAVSRWRRARRIVLHERPQGDRITWDDEQGVVLAALGTLPRTEREAIVLHHVVGLPIDDIARQLGVPAGTVKSWLSRGRRRLALELAPGPTGLPNEQERIR